ncbi:hypothetical protein [Acinetobacter sp.]|uniref:glucosamine inositolphosphorylceramide transferase family protein n=1 Tax=Acinetobacter sp. TaxID=472 RepID=UPI0038910BD9
MNLLRKFAKKYYNFVEKKREQTTVSRWYLRFGKIHAPFTLEQIDALHEIHAPQGHVYADPFIVEENGRSFIFLEEVAPDHPVGFLSAMEVFADGTHTAAQAIIKCDYHLSYPCVFKHEDTWYMIPESAQNNSIELWKCTNFPYQWQLDHVMMDNINSADTTPFYHAGDWYLFCALKTKNSKKYGNELHIFTSHDLFSQNWQAHPQNPVKKGILQFRPGGHLVQLNQKLIRPSQDSIKRYGGSLDLNEVVELSPTRYQEKFYMKLDSQWHPQDNGCHTFNIFNDSIVIDAIREHKKSNQ